MQEASAHTSPANEPLDRCIAEVGRRIEFPEEPAGRSTKASFTFHLSLPAPDEG